MLTLGIETATQVSSVALLRDGVLAAELIQEGRLTHSETLLPHIKQALRMAGAAKEELTGIAVSIGPGSFTGLRIGLATAKALAYALRLPLVGVPTMQALALHYPVPGLTIFSLVDAQKKNTYLERYTWQTGEAGLMLHIETPVHVLPLADAVAAAKALAERGEKVVLLGDVVQKKILPKRAAWALPAGVLLPPPELCMPRAAHVAVRGAALLAAGQASNVMDLEPLYIRRSAAEEMYVRTHGEDATTAVTPAEAKSLAAHEAHGTREVSR